MKFILGLNMLEIGKIYLYTTSEKVKTFSRPVIFNKAIFY